MMSTRGALPTFLIIGAMKSGTTSLFRYLEVHPDVFGAPGKELHFFDREFERGVDWYRSCFSDAGDAHAIGEATPNYMHSARAIERMAQIVPDARLIAVLRNPVDRAYSHYWHNRERGREPFSFMDAVDAEQDRMARARGAGLQSLYSYVDKGRYLRQLEAVCAQYPRESLAVVLTEDLANDPHSTYAQLCEHLGIASHFVPKNLGEPLNRYVHFHSRSIRLVAQRLGGPFGRVVGRVNATKRRRVPVLTPGDRRLLVERFESDNAALARWLGRDLSDWSV